MDQPSVDADAIAVGIAHLRGLDLAGLRACWHSTLGRPAPPHLPKHLLFRLLAYRLQAERLGDLDRETLRLLERCGNNSTGDRPKTSTSRSSSPMGRTLRPGTILMREWRGVTQRVKVLADGYGWNDKIFRSLSEAAFAITGTRWNGPRFFGLRDKPKLGSEVRP
jgi:hypothetical protein